MLKIGEFSKITEISISMLRNYDSLGLLKPRLVEGNNYRFYSEDQIVVASRINVLKHLGFSLSAIGEIKDLTKEKEILAMISSLIEEKEKEKEKINQQIRQLERIKKKMCSSNQYIFEAHIKLMKRHYTASFQKTVSTFYEEGILWNHIEKEMKENGIKPRNDQFRYTSTLKADLAKKEIVLSMNVVVENAFKDFHDIKCIVHPEMLVYVLPFNVNTKSSERFILL